VYNIVVVVLLVFVLTYGNLVEGSVISSVAEILAEDNKEVKVYCYILSSFPIVVDSTPLLEMTLNTSSVYITLMLMLRSCSYLR